MLDWLVSRGYALVILSAIGLHGYTVVVAYQLASPGFTQYAAALAAFWFIALSEAVVAYFAWRETGSMVNSYSVWILLWVFLVLVVALLAAIQRRLKRF